jgi:hypothetical protein
MPKIKMVAIAALAMALYGCTAIDQATREQQQRDAEVARQTCVARGLADSTPAMATCVEAQLAFIADQRRRALEQTETLPPASRVEPDSGMLCLPTAAGLSFTC